MKNGISVINNSHAIKILPFAFSLIFVFSKTTTKIETNNKLTITFYIYY
ncbi:hypothetical protein M098_0397 [Phocaeicola vulgatus str. 3775 SR(B) 19]|nr:hypothetical protein M098_0397 [Phocaeicola vulgatus str. 3775 SR(B) 19]